MSDWKYIVFDTPINGDTMILFPPYVDHSALKGALTGEILSAGFVTFSQALMKIQCYGRSTSLGIGSRGEADAYYAAKLLGLRQLPKP